jgi:TetR/AcrR family fatty acid metabolism transcriptional regulator
MKDSIQEQITTARRRQILGAAAKVFAEKGFHATTIKDIARDAGIADGTIYNYFENKHALLLGVFEQMSNAVRATVDTTAPLDMEFRSFINAYLRHPLMALQAENLDLFQVVMSEIMVNADLRTRFVQQVLEPMILEVEQHFQQWAEHRPGGRHAPSGLKVRALAGMILGLLIMRIMGDQSLDTHWDTLPDVLTDLVVDGLEGGQS